MSPLVVLIIVVVVVALILWATKNRTKKVKDRSPEWSASAKCKICGQDNPAEALVKTGQEIPQDQVSFRDITDPTKP